MKIKAAIIIINTTNTQAPAYMYGTHTNDTHTQHTAFYDGQNAPKEKKTSKLEENRGNSALNKKQKCNDACPVYILYIVYIYSCTALEYIYIHTYI